MSTAKVHPPTRNMPSKACNQLPPLLQTPAGIAILELQGTINVPSDDTSGNRHAIGRLEFPDYRPGSDSDMWMRRVYMFVGQHQRLAGEVKKLPRALAVVRRRVDEDVEMDDGQEIELEVVEVVRHKLVFSQRPEPVGSS